MIKKMGMEFTLIQTEDATRVNGATENNTEKECLLVLKASAEKVNGKMVKDYIGKMKLIQNTIKLNILLVLSSVVRMIETELVL